MTRRDPWLLIAAVGVVTYLFRFSFLFLFSRIGDVPPRVETALGYVPPAVLAALVAPAVLQFEATAAATLADGRLVAGLAGAAVAWRTESVSATVAVGMATLWLLRTL